MPSPVIWGGSTVGTLRVNSKSQLRAARAVPVPTVAAGLMPISIAAEISPNRAILVFKGNPPILMDSNYSVRT